MRILLLIPVVILSVICSSPLCRAQDDAAKPVYPISLARDGDVIYVVDLELPGVWKSDGAGQGIFVRGTRSFRQPLNRPRCIAIHPQGGVLVGDSATREVFHVAAQDAAPQALTQGKVGIAMALAVSPDGQTVYVGDAEQRAVLRFPIGGGEPETVVPVNARGLAFDTTGNLWAVTPDDDAIHRINIIDSSSEVVVKGRPFKYPNGLVWADELGFVTDGYGKSIWKFTADGQTELWHEGEPLVGPVGIAVGDGAILVADPRAKQVFEFDLSDKAFRSRF